MTSFSEERKKLEEAAKSSLTPIYQGKTLSVFEDKMEIGQQPITRMFVHHPGASAILPLTDKGDLILVRQYRRAVRELLFEIPAGIRDEKESPLETAQRELQEEIGLKANRLIPFGEVLSSPGFTNEKIHLFLATDLVKSTLPHDEDEAIDVHVFSPEKILELIEKGVITDAKTLVALLRYFTWKEYGKI